jgi:antitoxin VapB
MPLYIKDDSVAALVDQLAKARGLTKQDAVRQAVQAELDRLKRSVPAQEWLEAFWRAHPLPPPTGLLADKAFFDELSGDL